MLHALRYAADGFAVFPVYEPASVGLCSCGKNGCRGKHPRTINGGNDATTDPTIIKEWWTKWPNASIGMATGARSNNLAVVDLDGPEGLASGVSLRLTSAVTSLTGHGKQLFYLDKAGLLKNSVKKLAPGVDTRGDGGYVVVAPSLHPNGKRYSWAGIPLSAKSLAPLPAIFHTAQSSVRTVGIRKPEGWIATALEGMKNGNIDNTLTSVCGRLRHDGYSATDALSLLGPHADRAGASAGHLEDKIKNIWTRYEAAPQEGPFKSSAIDEFLQDITKVEWICEPFIARQSIGFVAGLPETLKTWLLVDLAVESARNGGMWLGLFPTSMERVLFIDQERFKGETQRRFAAVIAGKSLKPSALSQNLFIRCGTTTKLDLDQSYQAFRMSLQEIRPTLVIVDSFATFHNSQENDRMAIQNVLNRIKELRKEFNCSFVFINHESKSVFQNAAENRAPTAFEMVGSVGIPAAAEFQLTVRKIEPGVSLVHHTKSTLASASKAFTVTLTDLPDGSIMVKGTI